MVVALDEGVGPKAVFVLPLSAAVPVEALDGAVAFSACNKLCSLQHWPCLRSLHPTCTRQPLAS
jgi:hypothetical protein